MGLLALTSMVVIVAFAWIWISNQEEVPAYNGAIAEEIDEIDQVDEPASLVIGHPPEEMEDEEEIEPVDIPIDFAHYQGINEDIYAWIIIPGTLVDYPILQSDGDDQEFYLHHTFERLPSIEGSVFTQNYNGKDFTDINTVIYGHDMLDGSIFGSLRNYRDENYRREHDTIIIYTPHSILEYRIFSIVIFDNRHLMYAFCFDSEDGFYDFIGELQNAREIIYWSEDIGATFRDRIITLSTCTVAVHERLLVVAVLVDYQGEFSLGLH